jgi:spermidine synthase
LPLVLILFVGSGLAALVYEIVWFQLLQLVIGSSAVSLGVLLGTFMGGMCLGSLLLPRMVSPRRHPLRVYAAMELGIGLTGIAVLYGLPWLGQFYAAHASGESAGVFARILIAAICLLPATILMGATLPAIARWVQSTPQGVSWLGFFYGGNIAGAVVGCLLAGFYLLRAYDMVVATFVAVAVNLTVAACALLLSAICQFKRSETDEASQLGASAHGWQMAHLVIALSGLTAMSAEVVWTRLLSLTLGATTYTFSIILAMFLVGLGIGSSVGAALARSKISPRVALGCCQLLLAAAIAWATWMLYRSLPYWPIDPKWSYSPWFVFQIDLLRCAWAILPAACLWGASFPLALASACAPGQDPGRLVGGVYAANTIGTIIGALGTSMLLVGWIGTQKTQQLLIGISMSAAVLILVPAIFRAAVPNGRRSLVGATALLAGLVAAGFLASHLPALPWGLVAYGRNLPFREMHIGSDGQLQDDHAEKLFMGEGVTSSVAVSQLENGVRNFHVSGKIEASSENQDMRLQRMLGHIPALLHPHPKSVLIVGCGAGVTAGTFIVHPEIKRIVICEIEPLIPRVVTTYFPDENHHVTSDPRVEIVIDDARHYLLRTKEKFDIITSDPIHPWVKGAATLYTQEYFELVRRHLNPGGMVTQWVPLYESTISAVQSEIATFFAVFPHGTIWSNDISGSGYDTVMLGQADTTTETGDAPLKIDVSQLGSLWSSPDHAAVVQSLSEVGFGSPLELLATFAGRAKDLVPWLKRTEINRDQNLRLQYLAGLGLNASEGGEILFEILTFFKYPEDQFIASPEDRKQLEQALKRDPSQPK